MEPTPQPAPTIAVNATTPEKAAAVECSLPPKKKPASSASVLVSMLQKGVEQQNFHWALTRAFASRNIPLEKVRS